MSRKIVFAMLVVLSMVLMSFTTVSAEEKKTDGRAMATDDGLYWMDDTRLTHNPDTDDHPVLVVDSYGYSHVMWYRSGTHMYQKIDRYGNPAFNERRIATASLPAQHCGQPTERIGIDSQENFHVCWATRGSMYGPRYQKFSSSGNPMCQPIDLAPMAHAPHVVSLAVGRNNKAYFSYENEGSERIELAIVDQNFHLSSGFLSGTSGEGATIGVNPKNYAHVVNRQWSGAGSIYHTVFNHAGTVVVQNHRISCPTHGDGWSTPMPYLAFGKDGSVHWLQASTTHRPKSLYYFKTDFYGHKLTNDILITSNSADYGDICVDSKLNVYIIWGDMSDGDLHYVRIQSGKENATLKPVRLTKSPGESFAPQIAVDPDDSLHVAWVDNRDGNYEIYYKFAFSYGVELTMPPEEMAKIMFVHPNETKSANMTIRNLGGQNDTMHVSIDADFMDHEGGVGEDYKGSGWKVWMDEDYADIEMDAQEVLKFPIYVRGPYRGQPNDYIKVIVSATSDANPLKNDTVVFRVYLVVNHKIEVKCADSIHVTSAGVPTTYIITVANIGDIDEIVNLTLSGPPGGWKYYLNEYEVKVMPGDSKNVILTVTPPVDAPADSVGMVSVMGRCVAQPDIKDSAVTHTVVQPYMYIELTCDDPEHFVEPGNTTTYTIKVSNYGNVAGTVIIILEIVSGTGDWVATLDTNAVGVAGGETKEVLAMVTAPENAVAGSRLVLRIEGFNAEKTMKDDVLLTSIVKQVHKINVKVDANVGHVDPGGKGIYTITVENKGNGDEEVMLGTSKLPVGGWDLVYKATDDSTISENDKLYLRPGSSISFRAIVGVPLNALAGKYNIAGKLFDEKGNEYPIDMELTVNQIYDVGLTTTLTKQVGGPGQRVLFTLIVKNKGNGDDTMKMSLQGLPDGWNYEFRVNYEKSEEITLNATAVGKVTLAVMIPKDASMKTVTFTTRATSTGAMEKMSEIQLTIDVKMSDLEITKIDMYPAEPKANKPASVTVTIVNTGDVIVENVTIALYEDGALVGREKLERVPGNSNKTATFNWVPKSGKHELKFVVDPDDIIKEKDEENNVKKQPVDIRGGGLELLPGFDAVILMAAVFLGMFMVSWRRRKR